MSSRGVLGSIHFAVRGSDLCDEAIACAYIGKDVYAVGIGVALRSPKSINEDVREFNPTHIKCAPN
jgi:hypothetical protein